MNIFITGILAQNRSLRLVADAQLDNIGAKQEYMPCDWVYYSCFRNHGFRKRSLSYICK